MPARVLINLEDVTLRLGGKTIFDAMHMHICEGDKICLVGRNGAGKTTLLRLINGELELDAGARFAFPGVRIGYLAQLVPHAPNDTVRQFVISGLLPEQRNEEHFHLADMIIAPLSLNPDATMGTLSGGQLRRAALARSLVMEPDILLLDEPTNHLDLTAIEWLESYLAQYRGALVCVSHDRAFLTAISQKVFWIDRAAIRTCPKGYGEFDSWMEQIVEHEAKELQNLQKKLTAEIDWTQGGVTARRKRNQRRLNELRRLREKLKNDKAAYKQRTGVIDTDPLSVTQSSKIVAEFKNVTKSFERGGTKIPILEQFHLRVVRGDRIGIIGKNGSGKSTFIRLLTGEMAPDSGHITRGKTIDIRYFDQNRSALVPDATLWSTLVPQGGDYVFLGSGNKKRARHVCGYLKDFLFDPKAARDRVSTLSGGQQNRLLLAKILADPGNVMILDEPTNDLDMDTLDMLQELLSEYQGTLLIVSHDRDFLDRTVTEVLAFEGDAVVEATMGGYSDYLESKRRKNPTFKRVQSPAVATQSAPAVRSASSKMTFKLKHELEKLPARMDGLRQEMDRLKTLLADPDMYISDPKNFDDATRRYGNAQAELDAAELRWLELEALRLEME